MRGILLSGYEAFKTDTTSAWTGLDDSVSYIPYLYSLFKKFGVYAFAIAILLAASALMLIGHNPTKMAEGRDRLVTVLWAGLGLFSVGGLIALIYKSSL